MRALDLIAGFIEEPERAAEAVRRERPVAAGLLCFVLAGTSLFLAAQFLWRGSFLLPPSPLSWALLCLWRLAAGFLMAGTLHLLADAFGGEGRASSLFVLFGLSELPWSLALPAALLLRLSPWDGRLAPWLLLSVVGTISLSLKARSLGWNYGLSSGKAWLLLLSPYLAAAAFFACCLSLAAASLAFAVLRLFS